MQGLTTITDYFVIASGASDTQVKAIVDAVTDGLEPAIKPWHIEGYDQRRWVLLDFVDVVVHIFQRQVREYYDIERLWADAEIQEYADEEVTESE